MGEKCKLYADIQSLQTEVTGSGNLVTVSFPDGTKESILVDFGLYQGSEVQMEANSTIGFNPKTLSAILLTHAHIDHCGRIPMLYKHGAMCRTLMTNDTLKIGEMLLNNTASIIANDPQSKVPSIYSTEDCEKALLEFRACDYDDELIITPHIKARLIQNQHIAGAALIVVTVSYPGEKDINMLFSGDINSYHAFSRKMTTIPHWLRDLELSMVMCESTYGSRTKNIEELGKFKQDISEFVKQNKVILIPAFSFGRFQNVLLILKELQSENKIPTDLPIYIDGKLGIDITSIWSNLETVELKDFMPENVKVVDDKKALMAKKDSKIIVTTSGMGNFGPAREYIPHYIQHEDAVIYLTGYASPNTTARNVFEAKNNERVLVSGIEKTKKAIVCRTEEFSSHSKKDELISYIKEFRKIDLLLLNHGEPESKAILGKTCQEECNNVKKIGIIDGKTTYRVNSYGLVKSF